VVGIVARVQPHRRFDLLLAAAQQLFARRPNARLLVVGRGTRREQVAERPAAQLGIADRVVFAGYRAGLRRRVARDRRLHLRAGLRRHLPRAARGGGLRHPRRHARRGALAEIVVTARTGVLADETPRRSRRRGRLLADPARARSAAAASLRAAALRAGELADAAASTRRLRRPTIAAGRERAGPDR
jgi:glycosyltransferase involved in cell wall biosynthesis